MSPKHQFYNANQGIPREERNKIHPIWRGIGFLFIIIIPLLGYAASEVLLDLNGKNNWFPLPVDLIARPGQFLFSVFPDPLLYIKMLIAFVFILTFYMLFTFLSFMVIGAFGVNNNKRDPFYVPPVQRRRRRSTR
jgi:hypothetical protein